MRRTFVRLRTLPEARAAMAEQIVRLPESVQLRRFKEKMESSSMLLHMKGHSSLADAMHAAPKIVTKESALHVFDAAVLTFLLHIESRITSLAGKGFYTIGPCGEELLAPVGLVLKDTDPMALHYRHLSVSVARQLKAGESPENICLNRARGYCVAASDPVTGGAHCAIGGGPYDYIVTSTLASQTCPAVGRALGGCLAHSLDVRTPFPKDFVSFFSLGDGSLNNGHFLSGENFAEFAAFKNLKMPLVMCVTDNGIAISFKNDGFTKKHFIKKLQVPHFSAEGSDAVDVWLATEKAVEHARKNKRPVLLMLNNITRRFGHAATDRQHAYLDPEVVSRNHENDLLIGYAAQLVGSGVSSQHELIARFDHLHRVVIGSFDSADQEAKLVTRKEIIARTAAPLVPMPVDESAPQSVRRDSTVTPNCVRAARGVKGATAQVMRKHMNKVFEEALAADKSMVYMGEDVRHGGYYMVTDGLAKKHPYRVQDVPPDETALVGVGMGYSQAGLLPVVEIPYAKYLDCGMDMFTEAAVMHWLSAGKQPNGMVVRLQGFGRGVFGGNYHTHNMLSMPPGIDVVCYSNGRDYARAMRYALHQAKHGRVSMFVDCTELLNMRVVGSKEQSWEFEYTDSSETIDFDTTFLRPCGEGGADTLVVSYGGGIPVCIAAQESLASEGVYVDVVDCPRLDAPPAGLKEIVGKYNKVVFADICKEGQNPLASHMAALHRDRLFKDMNHVQSVAACRTYNPLGNTLTFLNSDDVVATVKSL